MKTFTNTSGDVVCEHGTAMDVHCCGCHSGFLFDINTCVCLDDAIDEALSPAAREAQASPSVSCSNDGGNQIPDPPVALPEREKEPEHGKVER